MSDDWEDDPLNWRSEDFGALEEHQSAHFYADYVVYCPGGYREGEKESQATIFLVFARVRFMTPSIKIFLNRIYTQKIEGVHPLCEVVLERFVYHKRRVS